jgi:hypothetical protein
MLHIIQPDLRFVLLHGFGRFGPVFLEKMSVDLASYYKVNTIHKNVDKTSNPRRLEYSATFL